MKYVNIKDNLMKLGEDKISLDVSTGNTEISGDLLIKKTGIRPVADLTLSNGKDRGSGGATLQFKGNEDGFKFEYDSYDNDLWLTWRDQSRDAAVLTMAPYDIFSSLINANFIDNIIFIKGTIKTSEDIKVNNNLVCHAGNKATWLQYVYPVNSIYISYVATNPKDIFGFGTWTLISDRFLVGAGNTYSLGATGGAATVTLTTAQIPAHTHAGPSHTHTINSHTHTGPNHTHTINSHTHAGPSHTHSVPQHKHNALIATTAKEAAGYGLPTGGGFTNRVIVQSSTAGVETYQGGSCTTGASGTGSTGGSGTLTSNASGTGSTGGSGTLTSNASGTANTGATGSGSSHENRPPYIAVYIWRRTA